MPNTRAVLSQKNPYYISKDRYLELKHYCAQIPDWIMERGMLRRSRFDTGLRIIFESDGTCRTNHVNRPTEVPEASCREQDLENRIKTYKEALYSAWPSEYEDLIDFFQMALIGEESYDKLSAKYPKLVIVPRWKWYDSYRKFFYILDKIRK